MRLKNTLILSAIISVFTVFIFLFLYARVRFYYEKSFKDSLSIHAVHHLSELDKIIYNYTSILELLSTSKAVSYYFRDPLLSKKRILDYRNTTRAFQSISLFDHKGNLIFNTDGEKKSEIMREDFFKKMNKKEKRIAKDIHFSRWYNKPFIHISIPVYRGSNSYAGFLVGSFNLSSLVSHNCLKEKCQQESLTKINLDIFDEKERLLYSNHDRENLFRKINTKKLLSQYTLYVIRKEAGYKNFQGNGWSVIIGIDNEYFEDIMLEFYLFYLGIFFILLLISFSTGYIASGFLSKPLIELSSKLNSIDYDNLKTIELPYPGKDEIILIYNQLNVMLRRIEESREEIIESHKRALNSEARWKFAIEGNKDGLWDWDLQTNKVFYSPRWKQMLGYDENEISNTLDEWRKRVHPDDLEKALAAVKAHMDGLTKHYECIHRVKNKKNTYIWILDRGKIIEYDENNNPSRFIGTHTDITESKMLERRLNEAKEKAEQADAAKSIFLASVSHEIRTPLNAIIGYSDILVKKTEDKKIQKYIISIQKNSHLLLDLINDILNLSQIESGKIPVVIEAVNVYEFFQDIIDMFRYRANKKGLEVKIKIDDKVPLYLDFDKTRFRQVFINLIGNSVKFTEKGYISVNVNFYQTGSDNGQLSISVTDTGPGIDDSLKPVIFGAFKRSDEKDKKTIDGFGLGLSIVKRLVEHMDGQILLQSNKDKGSRFTVLFKNISISRLSDKNDISEYFHFFSQSDFLFIISENEQYEILKEYMSISSVSVDFIHQWDEDAIRKKKWDVIIIHEDELLVNALDFDILRENSNKLILLMAGKNSAMEQKYNFDDSINTPIKQEELLTILSRHLYKNSGLEINNDIKPEIEMDTIAEAQRQIIRKNFLMQWENLKDVIMVDDVKKFAESLIRFTEDNDNLVSVHEYALLLKENSENFDIENMERQINEFARFVEKGDTIQANI